MAVKELTLKGSLSRNILAIMPQEEDKELFEKHLLYYLKNLQENALESEEFQKNLLKDFLQQVFNSNFINTYERTDLAIYNGETSESPVGVIIETKSLRNTREMMSKENLNTKAFQEIVHYYLHQRITRKNKEVKKCIITNGLSWFVIDSKEFEKHFIKNKVLNNNYNKWLNNQLSNNTTEFLYQNVIAEEIDKAIENGIKIAHFNLQDAISKDGKLKSTVVTNLYRFFTLENLLAKEIFADSNKLNKSFYNELLYIMGLQEVKPKGVSAKVILRLPENQRQHGSLMENTIDRLITIKDIGKDRQYDLGMKLSVIWMNRILFLKLLESQLITINKDLSYKFLTKEKLGSYEDIYDLFFEILAKKPRDRKNTVQDKFGYIPYLNSSLFEETIEETSLGISIDRLRERKIKIYKGTILKNQHGKKMTGEIDFLDYLFEFLDAYDFSTSIKKNKETKSNLINASVLGLIFEKINGYEDGSFYTPGRVTMYMSKRSIRKAVLEKVNEYFDWNCTRINEIEYRIAGRLEVAKQVSDVIDDLKICDPAVGSGHFLVSILNEIIALKSEINVLFGIDNKVMSNINCTVVNDELIVQDINGDNYSYYRNNKANEWIQKSIFEQKRKIIENCLFGVDPNWT